MKLDDGNCTYVGLEAVRLVFEDHQMNWPPRRDTKAVTARMHKYAEVQTCTVALLMMSWR